MRLPSVRLLLAVLLAACAGNDATGGTGGGSASGGGSSSGGGAGSTGGAGASSGGGAATGGGAASTGGGTATGGGASTGGGTASGGGGATGGGAATGGGSGGGGSAAQHSVDLAWVASTSANVDGYNINRGTSPGFAYAKINASLVIGTAYTDTTVQSGTSYRYQVTAVSGGVESVPSAFATAVVP